MRFAPLYLREISLGPSGDSDQKCMAMLGLRVNQGSESQYRERERDELGARPNIVWQKEQKLVWPDIPDILPDTPGMGSDIRFGTPDTPGICPDTPERGWDVQSCVLDTPGIGPDTLGISYIVMACLIWSLRVHRSWHVLPEAAINYWIE